MLSVKIFNMKDNRCSEFNKTLNNLYTFIENKFNKNTKIITDNSCVEIVTNSDIIYENEDVVVTELLIKKRLIMKACDFNDKQKLDKYIDNIKNFCEQANEIETLRYVPLTMR